MSMRGPARTPVQALPAGGPARDPLPRPTDRAHDDTRPVADGSLTDQNRQLAAALQAAREAEQRLQTALWAARKGIWEWHPDCGHVFTWGLSVADTAVVQAPMALGSLLRAVHRSDRALLLRNLRALQRGLSDHLDVEFRLHLLGDWRWLRIRGRLAAPAAAGAERRQAPRVTGTVRDVSAEHAEADLRLLMAHAFASTPDALAVVDGQGVIQHGNAALADLLGEPLAHLLGQRLDGRVKLGPAALQGPGWRGDTVLRSGGDERTLAVSISPAMRHADAPQRHVVALQDITERRRAQQALTDMALSDNLTGLANRAAINRHLADRVLADPPAPFALMFMDLDGFKGVNDAHGHRAGDAVLIEVAQRLRRTLPGQFIGRWGGDEFVVILADGSSDYELRESAQLILATVGRPVVLERDAVVVTPSIGAVFHPADGRDAALLLRRADAAMYGAKSRGRNGLVIYEPSLDDGTQRRSRLQSLMRIDAERKAFFFEVLPKVDVTGRVTGAELLMRWNTEAFGAVSPVEFIPLADETGAIDLLGRQALDAAARTAAEVRALGSRATVAVNLSPTQVMRPDLERNILRACEEHQVEPWQIELELTESALVADNGLVARMLTRLARRGFKLALDDFGTGYASLNHLGRLPFHKVKLDRSLVQDLDSNPRTGLMLEGVVSLCHRLGMATVAEGVETRSQFERLRAAGVEEYQGFLFARPQPREQWLALLGGDQPTVLMPAALVPGADLNDASTV